MTDAVDLMAGLRAMASAAHVPCRGRDRRCRAPGTGDRSPRRLGRSVHRGGIVGRSVVRARCRHGRRATLPARAHPARGERTPQRAFRRPHPGRRPARAHGRLPQGRRSHRRRMGRTIEGHARPVPSGVRAWATRCPRRRSSTTCARRHPGVPDDEAVWASAFVVLAWGLSGTGTPSCSVRGSRRPGSDAVERPAASPPADPLEVVPGAPRCRCSVRREAAREGAGFNRGASRTRPARLLLANDPHLLAVQPGIWMEATSRLRDTGRGAPRSPSPRRAAGPHRSPRLGRHERQRRRAGPVRRAPVERTAA